MTQVAAARSRKNKAVLRPLRSSQVTLFKVRNRRGFAAICLGNLCEGDTPQQAFERLLHPLRRMGYALPGQLPAVIRD